MLAGRGVADGAMVRESDERDGSGAGFNLYGPTETTFNLFDVCDVCSEDTRRGWCR